MTDNGLARIKLSPNIANDSMADTESRSFSQHAHKFKLDNIERKFQTDTLDVDHMKLDDENAAKKLELQNLRQLKQEKLFLTQKNSWSQANLLVSSIISTVYATHTIYWEYIRYNHSRSFTYQQLEVSLALCVLNLVPSLTMLMDIYSFVISFAVLIHAIWIGYHTFTVWAVELCYGAIDDGCNAIMLYKNITLSLQAVVVSHQILLLITGCHKKQTKYENIRIQSILAKASQLDIQSECGFEDENDGLESDTTVDEVDTTKVPSMVFSDQMDMDNQLTISESAAEEIGMENVVQRNKKRVRKVRQRSNSLADAKIWHSSFFQPQLNDQCSSADDSTFEMYGVGTPKETHGNHLHKPFGMKKIQI